MERRDDAPAPIDDGRPTEAPAFDETGSARDALRATPNQHSFDDEEPDDDAARNYHGIEDNG